MARWHDLAVNVFVRDVEPVFAQGWTARVGLGPEPGTGFTSEQVDVLSGAVDASELDAYFHAVLERTESWISGIADDELAGILDSAIDTDAAWAKCSGLLPPAAAWVPDFQRGWTAGRFLRWTALGHLYWHFGELLTVTTALGHPVG